MTEHGRPLEAKHLPWCVVQTDLARHGLAGADTQGSGAQDRALGAVCVPPTIQAGTGAHLDARLCSGMNLS